MGTACTQFQDFTEKAGALAVTNRVHVGVDYIATPGEPTSIELTGLPSKSLLPEADGMLSADRIMVIDCGGTCGIAGPSESVEAPNATVDSWSTFWPKTYFRDMVSEDQASKSTRSVLLIQCRRRRKRNTQKFTKDTTAKVTTLSSANTKYRSKGSCDRFMISGAGKSAARRALATTALATAICLASTPRPRPPSVPMSRLAQPSATTSRTAYLWTCTSQSAAAS